MRGGLDMGEEKKRRRSQETERKRAPRDRLLARRIRVRNCCIISIAKRRIVRKMDQ